MSFEITNRDNPGMPESLIDESVMPETSLDALLLAAQTDDTDAVDHLLQLLREPASRGAAFRRGFTYVDQDDVVQSTYEKILKTVVGGSNYQVGTNLGAYAYRTAQNIARDAKRRENRITMTPVAEFHDVIDEQAAEHTIMQETRASMEAFLVRAGCNADQATAFVLCHAYGMSYLEVAEFTGVGIEAVRTRIHRALVRTRQNFSINDPGHTPVRDLFDEELSA